MIIINKTPNIGQPIERITICVVDRGCPVLLAFGFFTEHSEIEISSTLFPL